jgi:hypothetical protein
MSALVHFGDDGGTLKLTEILQSAGPISIPPILIAVELAAAAVPVVVEIVMADIATVAEFAVDDIVMPLMEFIFAMRLALALRSRPSFQ